MIPRLNLFSTDEENRNLTTSKGNQTKFFDNNNFYKVDFLGYEGLAEAICSRLLCISSCANFVKYEETKISFNSKDVRGCKSKNFLTES